MATTGSIGRAGNPLDIKLGESPNVADPIVNVELQQIYNALHLLGNYMSALRENLESADGQTPAESLRFRRTYWGTAGQAILPGSVVSGFNGLIYNGVSSRNPPVAFYDDSAVTIGSTGNRTFFGLSQLGFGIALTAAAPGELVQVGVGPGVLQVGSAKCGQIIWGVDARSVFTTREANQVFQFHSGVRNFVGNGGIYLANVTGKYYIPNPVFTFYNWEGFWLPGFPNQDGGTYLYDRAFLYPIGICVADGYVMFSDYKRSDPIPLRTI